MMMRWVVVCRDGGARVRGASSFENLNFEFIERRWIQNFGGSH